MTWSAGTFSRTGGSTAWGDDRDAATEIEAGLHDTHDEDLAQGINDCLHKGGQNAATADISMGSNKLTNLAAPTAANDAARLADTVFGAAVAGDEFLARFASTPTGWTISPVNNKAIRIVSGSPGSDGGSNTFSQAFNTIVESSLVVVSAHSINTQAVAAGGGNSPVISIDNHDAHSHTTNVNVQYRDFVIYVKS